MARKLSDRVKVVRAVAPAVVAIGAVTGIEIAALGFDRALFVFNLGACGAGAATLDLKVQESATSGGSFADHSPSNALAQITKAAGQAGQYTIDFAINPAKTFIKVVGTVGTDTFAVSGVCILYGGSGSFPKTAASVAAVTVE